MAPKMTSRLRVPHILLLCYTCALVVGQYDPALSWDVCSPSRIVVTLTGGADGGIIYIKGYGSACKQDTFASETTHEFEFDACGIGIAETYFTIIVQKNPLYQKGGDLQESLLCIYDLSDISVGNGLNVGDKDDDAGINKTVKPTARMNLYKNGVDVGGSDVKLTDLVTMIIQLDDEFLGNRSWSDYSRIQTSSGWKNQRFPPNFEGLRNYGSADKDFDIKARSCTANFIDLTTAFCAEDTDLFPDFVHVTQGVVTSSFGAFRTTDLGGGYVEMIYTCTIQVCRGLCSPTTCNGKDSWGRRKRSADDDIVIDDLNVGTAMSVGTDIDVTPTESADDNSICVNNILFILSLLVLLSALVVSVGMTTYTTRKLSKRNEALRKLPNDQEIQREAQQTRPPLERNQSVSVISTVSEPVIVKTTHHSNHNTATVQNTSSNSVPKDTNDNKETISKRNSLKTQTSVTVMYNSSQGNYVNRQSETANSDNKAARRLATIPESNSISETDLIQLIECRNMLKTMDTVLRTT